MNRIYYLYMVCTMMYEPHILSIYDMYEPCLLLVKWAADVCMFRQAVVWHTARTEGSRKFQCWYCYKKRVLMRICRRYLHYDSKETFILYLLFR